MKILYVDEDSSPNYWVREENEIFMTTNYNITKEILARDRFDILDLSLDLIELEDCGSVIRYIVQEEIELPQIYLHSCSFDHMQEMIKMCKHFTDSEVQYYIKS